MRAHFITTRAAFMSCLFAFAAWSAGGDEFELPWSTIGGGGVLNSTGGGFELSSTIGQPDAGRMSGGGWVLTGGFWFETSPGDFNSDGAVNLLDYAELDGCLAGPASIPNSGCAPFDLNDDGHVDLEDFAQFQRSVDGA